MGSLSILRIHVTIKEIIISQEPKNSNLIGLQLGTKMNVELDKFHAHLKTESTCHSRLPQECTTSQPQAVTVLSVSVTTSQ